MQLNLGFELEACYIACEPGDLNVPDSSQIEAVRHTGGGDSPQHWTWAFGSPQNHGTEFGEVIRWLGAESCPPALPPH